jgi:hypothetical protein
MLLRNDDPATAVLDYQREILTMLPVLGADNAYREAIWVRGERKMSVRKRALVIVMVGALLLAVGIGPGVANPARALPQSSAEPARATIPYGGRLSDETGQPVADGAYDFTFTLYDTEASGEPLWSEVQRGVVVSRGEFQTFLGSVVPIPAAVLEGPDRWLAVSVRGPGETEFSALAPRQRLHAVAATTAASPAANGACPHDHFGEVWTGSDPGAGLRITNSGWGHGVSVGSARNNGVYVDSAGFHGVSVASADNDGVYVGSAQNHGVYVDWAHLDGVHVRLADRDGVYVMSAGYAGVHVESADDDGVYVESADDDGVYVESADDDGVYVESAGNPSTTDSYSAYHNGFEVAGTGGYGLWVGRADRSGVYVKSAGLNGVVVESAGHHGVDATSSSAPYYGGRFVNTAEGAAGLYAAGGSNTAPDLVLGAHGTGDDGRIYSSPALGSSDILLFSNDEVHVHLDENDDPQGATFTVYNGADIEVFQVDESGAVTFGSQAGSYGARVVYATQATGHWLEDFGTAELVDGQATVAIEPVFAQMVSLGQYHVFLTPLGDCPLYVADKAPASFTVRAMGGQRCSIAFDYRLVAKRLGYEDARLEPADVGSKEDDD